MEFISSAYAQTPLAQSAEPGFLAANAVAILLLIGVCVVVVSLVLVFSKTPVTSGHSIILGVGMAFVALPFITAFEWSDSGFKITMKSAAEELTGEVARLTEENGRIREELLQLNEAAKTTVAKLEQLSSPGPASGDAATPAVRPGEWDKFRQPEVYEDFSVRNRSAIETNKESLSRLQDLQNTLQAPVPSTKW